LRSATRSKAFREGEVVGEFVGALAPTAVAQFLDELTGPTATEKLVGELQESGELPKLPEVVEALEQDEHEHAFELLLEAIGAAEGKSRERLITLTVGLFGELGHEHPLTMRYRRQLAASLY
jgi:thioredoxin-like negative regulator of GroEL